MLNRGGPHSFQHQAKQNRPGRDRPAPLWYQARGKTSFTGSFKLARDALGHRVTQFLPAAFPRWSALRPCCLRGAAKPGLAGKGGERGAFLRVQALGRQAPAPASAVLGPPNPGARGDSEQSSNPFDASLAAAPARSGRSPRERTLGEKQDFSSPVCVCL